jgi:hypothetical protein
MSWQAVITIPRSIFDDRTLDSIIGATRLPFDASRRDKLQERLQSATVRMLSLAANPYPSPSALEQELTALARPLKNAVNALEQIPDAVRREVRIEVALQWGDDGAAILDEALACTDKLELMVRTAAARQGKRKGRCKAHLGDYELSGFIVDLAGIYADLLGRDAGTSRPSGGGAPMARSCASPVPP